MINSLRKKFIFAAMASTFAVLSVIMGILNIANYLRMVDRADETLEELRENGGHFSQEFMFGRQDFDKGKMKPKNLIGEGDDRFSPETPFQTRYFSVEIASGEVSGVSLDNIAAVDEDDAESYAESVMKSGNEKGFVDIYRYLYVDSDEGPYILFMDCRQEILSCRNTAAYSAGVSVLGLLAVFLLVFFWSKRIFRPVAESYEKQKRFITDASHEIKTPLTIIDANTEVIEMESGKSEWTENTRAQVKRLTALTNQMVKLSRLDENPEISDKTEFDFSALSYEVVDHFSSVAELKNRHINVHIEDNVMYTGDEMLIRQLISILVDNAMKYAVEGTEIDIDLRREGKKVKLLFRNMTSDMNTGDQNILFERFYRPDSSRNSETGGSGIGLSLAKKIVESHKGKITAEVDVEGYICFTVIL